MNLLTLHRKTLCAIAMATGVFSAYAAIVDPYSSLTFEQMQAQAKRDGAVFVTIYFTDNSHIDLTSSIFRTEMEQTANRLYTELGAERWTQGTPDSGLFFGNTSGYITFAGLDILKRSTNAYSFTAADAWSSSSYLSNVFSNNFKEFQQKLIDNGFVDAVITVNVDGLSYDIISDGRLLFHGDETQIQDFYQKATKILDSLLPEGVVDVAGLMNTRQSIEKIRAGQSPFDPRISMKLNLRGAVQLVNNMSKYLRAIEPKGFMDVQNRSFDPILLENAAHDGFAKTELQMKVPIFPNFYSSSLSKKQSDAALARAMNDILVKAGLQGVMKLPEFGDIQWTGLIGSVNPNFYMPYYGNATGNLTVSQLERLKALNDDRIHSISAPLMATVALGSTNTSEQSSNTATQPTVMPETTSGISTAVDSVFNWAQIQPTVALGTPSTLSSQTGAGYRFRYYPASNSYLGVNEIGIPKLHYLGALSSQKLLDLGYLTDWLSIASSHGN